MCSTSPRASATPTPAARRRLARAGRRVAIAGPYRSAGRGSPLDQLRPSHHAVDAQLLVSRNLPFVAANESQQDAWNVLADGTRRAILESLADGPAPSARSPSAPRQPTSRVPAPQGAQGERARRARRPAAPATSSASTRPASARSATSSTRSGTGPSATSRPPLPIPTIPWRTNHDADRTGDRAQADRRRRPHRARLRRVHRPLRRHQAAGAQPARRGDRDDDVRATRRRPHLRPRRGRQRMPLGPHPGLRAADACRVQLGHRPDVAARVGPGQRQRGRGPLHRRRPDARLGSSSSTATSTATAPGGSTSRPASTATRAGRATSRATSRCSRA